ncbi:hypothetical protein D9M70_621670 [compost metagenome]
MQMTGLFAGRRVRVMPSATMRASQRIGAPAAMAARPAAPAPGEKRRSRTTSTMPQAWITRTASFSRSAGMPARSASARMMEKELR